MDPQSLILAAITAAASGAAGEAGRRLLAMLVDRFKGKPEAEVALEQYQRKPQVWESPVRDAMKTTGADRDEKILELARRVLGEANVLQTASGGMVTQIGGDAAAVVQAGRIDNITILPADSGLEIVPTELPAPPEGRDWRYQEMAGWIGNVSGQEPSVAVALDFGATAEVFESDEKDRLLAIAREFLGFDGGRERQDDEFVEVSVPEVGADGRKPFAQFYREGVASVWIYRPCDAIPWDSVLMEGYSVFRFLCSRSVRQLFGAAAHGRVTLGVTWPAKGIAPTGLRLNTLRAVAPSEPPGWRGASRSFQVEFGTDPWPMLQDFMVHALSRAGYKHHEKTIRGMSRDIVLEICFPDPHPLRYVMARYPL